MESTQCRGIIILPQRLKDHKSTMRMFKYTHEA